MAEKTFEGGCHCGQVRFEVKTDPSKAIACNCSICAKQGLWLTFAQPDDFKLHSGEGSLSEYMFNRHVIRHKFCTRCGVESFARGQAPNGVEMIAVNVRCLDGIDIAELTPAPFDGKSL